MEDLKTISDIINESVRDSSYVTVIISSCVFIIYTLVTRIVDYFKTKAKDKPLLEMSKAMKEMGNNIAKLNSVLNKTFDDAEKRETRQCEKAIQLGFQALGFKISQECSNIIVHNNIDKNKELIRNNLTRVINTEYYKLYSALSAFEIHDINIATKLKEEWTKEIADALIQIIYDGQYAILRIAHINDKINILISEYSIYISNKIFNT